ncbi:protein S-acyltransferase [Malassezia cuniculi]|uniref:Protein S-acyltransferase n=1 Tax=Malassezia cuniculi TaxID=948313 RepID=A0AAF0ET36_9BASI|nr:protein S-acyltransferase [Malassezia cuniculi]
MFHLYLILRNRTTLEYMEGVSHVQRGSQSRSPSQGQSQHSALLSRLNEVSGPRATHQRDKRFQKFALQHNMYDTGLFANWRQVMGTRWWLWLVPLGDPCVYANQ